MPSPGLVDALDGPLSEQRSAYGTQVPSDDLLAHTVQPPANKVLHSHAAFVERSTEAQSIVCPPSTVSVHLKALTGTPLWLIWPINSHTIKPSLRPCQINRFDLFFCRCPDEKNRTITTGQDCASLNQSPKCVRSEEPARSTFDPPGHMTTLLNQLMTQSADGVHHKPAMMSEKYVKGAHFSHYLFGFGRR